MYIHVLSKLEYTYKDPEESEVLSSSPIELLRVHDHLLNDFATILPTVDIMGDINALNTSTLPIVYRDSTDPAEFHEAAWGRVFNERRDLTRKPKAVVRATTSAHIKEAVDRAIEENVRVSVRSGGHSWAGWSVRDQAILIDLGNLRELHYDEETQIVSCSTSYTGRVLNKFLNERGRMFAGGHCPDVGLGGFLLQGGMGWNCKV